MWVVRFPGSVSGTDTSAESPRFRLIRPSQLTQSTLESPCRLRFVISISGAHTRRPPAPLSLSPCAAPSYALPVALLQSWVRHSPMAESRSRPFSRAFLIHDAGLPKLSGLHNHRSSPTCAERLRALLARTAITLSTLQRTLRSYLHVLLFRSVRWSDKRFLCARVDALVTCVAHSLCSEAQEGWRCSEMT